jgi:preprotein translocase subunit SecY
LVVVWLTNLIDKKGIGNGTSLFILFNIIVNSQNKNLFQNFEWNSRFLLECFFLFFFIFLISISQFTNVTIPVVSARQLKFLEKEETRVLNLSSVQTSTKASGLLIRFNQAGIFPIIIASNLLPFLASISILKPFLNIFYYFIILGFNYFYTTIFWDPEKIAEQLRKASVSIANIRPGKPTISYLENIAFRTSVIGGIFLCVILFLYDCVKIFIQGSLLSQINISSLIIVVGICFEIQKTIKTLYKNK